MIQKNIYCAVLELRTPKALIKDVLASHTVAMVTYCATKILTMYSPMVWQFFYAIFFSSTDMLFLISIIMLQFFFMYTIHVCTYFRSYTERFHIKLLTRKIVKLNTCMHYFKYIY